MVVNMRDALLYCQYQGTQKGLFMSSSIWEHNCFHITLSEAVNLQETFMFSLRLILCRTMHDIATKMHQVWVTVLNK